MSGVSNLYTVEFLEQTRQHLKPGGVFLQFFISYGMDEYSLRSLFKAILQVYPYVQLWSADASDLLIVGSESPLILDWRAAVNTLAQPKMGKELSRININSVHNFLENYMLDAQQLAAYVGDVTINSDKTPIVEFNSPKSIGTGTWVKHARVLFKESGASGQKAPVRGMDYQENNGVMLPVAGVRLEGTNWNITRNDWLLDRQVAIDAGTNTYGLALGQQAVIFAENEEVSVKVIANIAATDRATSRASLQSLLSFGLPDGIESRGKITVKNKNYYWGIGVGTDTNQELFAISFECGLEGHMSARLLVIFAEKQLQSGFALSDKIQSFIDRVHCIH